MVKNEKSPAHTPGPWTYTPQMSPEMDEYLTFAVETEGSQREIIAMIPAEERSKETTEANARLIAAAPDMLEELKDTLEFMSWFSFNFECGNIRLNEDAKLGMISHTGTIAGILELIARANGKAA